MSLIISSLPVEVAITVTGVSLGVLASCSICMLVFRVNRRLPKNRQLPLIGSTMWKVTEEYKRLYPGSLLYMTPWILGLMGIPCAIALLWELGFFN